MEIQNYWTKRRLDEIQTFQKKSEDKLMRQIATQYQRMAKEVAADLERLYLKILAEGGTDEALVSHLYQYNRYYETLGAIQSKLTSLGMKEQKYFTNTLTNLYEGNSKRIKDQFNLSFDITQDQINRALNAVWAPDKMNWSQRIWKHQDQLINSLSATLIDATTRGVNPDKLVERVMGDFGVGFREAQRLVVTECSYIMNQSALDSYAAAGVDEYIFLGDQAGACEECKELNGQRFRLTAGIVGENLPPIHPNCRCSIIGVIE